MQILDTVLQGLPLRHRIALNWFVENMGADRPWPGPIHTPEGATLIATKAKGIYKPEWSAYALSVRQTLDGPYADKDPLQREDGTWLYSYFQENPDPGQRDSEYTNRGLMQCLRDRVPVGVMRQISGKPKVVYRILGLATVAGWDDGYFFLEGFSKRGEARPPSPASELDYLGSEAGSVVPQSFDPASVIDARRHALGFILVRRGQSGFRQQLLNAYESKCVITGCDAAEALEAAHIVPYRGPQTDRVDNGLLLRADLHTLFDLGLIAIHEDTYSVIVSHELRATSYGLLAGTVIRTPRMAGQRPSKMALASHREWAGL